MKEGYEKKCYICKKKFSTYSAYEGWTYQRHAGMARRFFCSYECMRKYDTKGKVERMIYFEDTCANYCGDEDNYICFIHGAITTCDGCKDFKTCKEAADEEWERRQHEGKRDGESR